MAERNDQKDVEKKAFTISEASAELGIPIKEVERLIAEGKLEATTVDGVIMIDRDSIEDFREAFTSTPGASF
jgi:excisionase family DNA binding protein